MKTAVVGSNTQPPSYSCSCQGKALLVALTVLAYIVAIVGTLFLTKAVPNNVLNNPQILVGVGVPLAFILTGACIYFFRKSENIGTPSQTTTTENTSSSTSQAKPYLAIAKLRHKGGDLDIEIDLNGGLEKLKQKIYEVTGVENAFIAVDGEILLNSEDSLRAQEVTPTCSLEVFEVMPPSVLIEKGGTPMRFVMPKDQSVKSLRAQIENRFSLPPDSVVLRIEGSEEGLGNDVKIQSIKGKIKMAQDAEAGHFYVNYDDVKYTLSYFEKDTVKTLKKRIGSLTGLYSDQQRWTQFPFTVTDNHLISALGIPSGATIKVTGR